MDLDRARFVLAEKFNAATAQVGDPFRCESLALREIARRRDDYLGPDPIEKGARAGNARVMLAFNQDLTGQVRIILEEKFLGGFSAVRHQQDPGSS